MCGKGGCIDGNMDGCPADMEGVLASLCCSSSRAED
jgi:hypothetical protein